jgi:hypothetical protein
MSRIQFQWNAFSDQRHSFVTLARPTLANSRDNNDNDQLWNWFNSNWQPFEKKSVALAGKDSKMRQKRSSYVRRYVGTMTTVLRFFVEARNVERQNV